MKTSSVSKGNLTPAYAMSWAMGALLIVAALPGALITGLYKDPAKLVAVDRGTDVVALAVAPALVISMILAGRGSARALLVWAGLVGWVLYNYVIYAFSLHFNPLFLVYVALVSLSTFTLATLIRRMDLDAVAADFHSATPARVLAGFLFLVGGVFVLIWLSDVLPATFSGTIPQRLKDLQTVSNPVEINDLAIVMPLLFVAGIWAWQHKPAGYVIGGALTTLAAVTMTALLPGGPLFGTVQMDPLYAAVAVLSFAVLGLLLWRMGREAGAAAPAGLRPAQVGS